MSNLFRPHRSRRRFMTGAGAAALSLPMLSQLATRAVQAADSGVHAKRLLVFFTPNDTIDRDYWLPAGQGDAFDLTTLPPMFEPLQPHASRITMVGDLVMESFVDEPHGAGHVGMGHMLTGRRVIPTTPTGAANPEFWASGVSVDQYVADALGVDALNLSVRTGASNGNTRMSYRAANQPVHPMARPDDAFDALFSDFQLPAPELAALRARRLSVLDHVAGDLGGLAARLPKEAADKLDVHLSMVRDLENKLSSDVTVQCAPGQAPAPADYDSNAAVPAAARRQIDVMVQALACGLTDVGSIQIGSTGAGNLTANWADEGLNFSTDCHSIAHEWMDGSTQLQRRVDLEVVFSRLFAYLLDGLAAVPEGDGGSLLDNTLVLWTKSVGTRHRPGPMLNMLCGGAGGALNTGRFLSFPETPHNDLLVSVCNLMGLGDTTFGDAEFCTGPLQLS